MLNDAEGFERRYESLPDEISVDLGNGLSLEIRESVVKLGSSAVVGKVAIRDGEILVDERPLDLRLSLKCPVKVGGTYLCGEAIRRPRFIYKVLHGPGVSNVARLAELYATDELNKGNCLAYYVYLLARGRQPIWSIYYRGRPSVPRGPCEFIDRYLVSRGLREGQLYDPHMFSSLDVWIKAALGLVKFRDALELVERNWRGFSVAMRYGLYSALKWSLPLNRDAWMFLLGIYSALDPVPVPGGIAVDNSIVRALPYLVAKIAGAWLVLFSSAGHPYVAANFNVMSSGGRIRGYTALCERERCKIGDLYFNICTEQECAIVRTWDYEYRGAPRCSDLYTFIALTPCK